jgi:TM2 domain-containing membrane protein YozV
VATIDLLDLGNDMAQPTKNPGTAAVLSFFIPGVGQIYNGDFLRGLFWLIVTPGMWIGTGGLLGWVCHLIASYTAYHRAVKKNVAELDARASQGIR